MAEVSSQVTKVRLRINALFVPGEHTVHDEGMSQIVNAWTATARRGFEFGTSQNAGQHAPGSHD